MAYDKEQFIKAIENSGGYISLISERVGCHISTVYDWIEKDEDVAAAIKREKVRQVDHAEGKLQSLIKKENPTAIIFYLKTQGKDRGYYEHRTQDITSSGQPLTINFVPADHDADGPSDV
jgi:secreted trypsin-like serine protease